jgi:putative ABC transport system permease protein
MFKNYFVVAFRNLVKNKVYSFINIAGLTMGLACAMLILLYTKDEVSYDKFLPGVNNIYRITATMVNPDGSVASKLGISSAYHGPAFNSGVPEIASYVRWQGEFKNIKKGTEVIGQDMTKTDSNFFSVFQFPLLYGNAATALQQPNSIVLNETTARKYFGTADVVGKTLQIQEGEEFKPYVVTAVAKDCPQNSSIQFQMLKPIEKNDPMSLAKDDWLNFYLNTFVVLAPGADVKQVERKMNSFYQADAKDVIKMVRETFNMKENAVYTLQPYTSMHLSKDFRADNGLSGASNPMYSYILSGIALFVLLIACINFINLTIARSLKRAREIGVRKVVGGDRRQLIFQFLGESYFICVIAFLLALGIAQLLLPFFNQLSNKALSLSYLFDVKLVAGYLVLFLVTGFLAGFYPALVLSGFNPVQTLYNRFKLGGKNYLQKSLVVLQFSLATFLIIATVTIYRQFNYLTTKNLGYNDKNVLTISKWGVKYKDMIYFREQLLKNPNVENVAFKNVGHNGTTARVNGTQEIDFAYEWMDENYLPLYKIPVVKGRNFSKDFASDSIQSVIVNEAFVKKAGWKSPIGQIVDFWYNKQKFNVVGVVKDYHYESLGREIRPQLFNCHPGNFGMFNIKLKEGAAASVLPVIEQVYKSVFPLSPYSYSFKDIENAKQYDNEAKWKKMMLFGAFLTIFISCIGLFGLSVLAAEKRIKEIGVRKVLGASVASVVTALSKDFLKLVAISLLIALPVAWYLTHQWLQSYPYRTTMSWWLFAATGFSILAVALLTVCFQAIRAAVANPVNSLRTE